MADSRRLEFFQETVAHESVLPLLPPTCAGAPIAWYQGRPVGREGFLGHVLTVAKALPSNRFVINLCENRYLFLVAFAAVGIRHQTNLLPTSRVKAAIAEAMAQFPDSHVVDDAMICRCLGDGGANASARDAMGPRLPADHVMAITFTSGSTGSSQPHAKRWGELVAGARLAELRFGMALTPGTTIVATVPPQHMYGLETSIMLPLTLPLAMHEARPLWATEIAAALAAVPAPRVLVTTPAHLRLLAESTIEWPSLALIISATAPLSRTLAQTAEVALSAPVTEIYGCTEAGSIASRRTVDEADWTPYDGFSVEDGWVHARHLPERVRLNDVVEPRPEGRFALLGRAQDMVNIAGKRTSLGFLNRVLTGIDGVVDGVFVMPEEAGDRPVRLAALVVAPTLTKRAIVAALAERIDPLFLPRPLLLSDRLPRNDVGKLRREELLGLIRAASTSEMRRDD